MIQDDDEEKHGDTMREENGENNEEVTQDINR